MGKFRRLLLSGSLATLLSACGSGPGNTLNLPPHSPSDRDAMLLKVAHASEAGGDLRAAETFYAQAASASDRSVSGHRELAEFYRRHHNDKQAIIAYQSALVLSPGDETLVRGLANSQIDAGRPNDALATLDKAMSGRAAQDGLAYNSKGAALDRLGRYDEARVAYEKAVALSPDEAMVIGANAGMSDILAGHYDAAVTRLKPLAARKDATPVVRQNLALAYGMQGNMTEALRLNRIDMPAMEAEENIRFYRMLAEKHRTGPARAPLSPAEVQKLFPETEQEAEDGDKPIPSEQAKPTVMAAPVILVSVAPASPQRTPQRAPAPVAAPDYPQAAESHMQTDFSSPPAAIGALPVPVLKPADLTAPR